MLRNLAFKMEKYFPEMKEYLQQADIKMLVPTYLQKVLTYSLIVSACSFMPLFLFLFMILNFDILVSFLISLAFLPVFFSISLFFGVSYPKSRASSRRQSIEANLPFAITHMSTIAASGVSPTNIFKLISEFKEYGELAKECEKVVKNVELFGLDITSALREVGRRSPSKRLREFFEGMATTIDTGGNLVAFLEQQADRAMFEYRIKRQKYMQSLSMIADLYVAVALAAPLFIIVLFVLLAVISGGQEILGLPIDVAMKLTTFVGIPMLNGLFLFMVSAMQPEM